MKSYGDILQVPDVNILVYAHRSEIPENQFYADWLDRHANSGGPFGMSGPVLCGFVRVVTGPKVEGGPTTLKEALAFCDQFTSSVRCRIINPGGSHWRLFGELCRHNTFVGGGTSDISHAATAIEHGVEWVTRDKGFSSYPGLRWRHMPTEEVIVNPHSKRK